MITNQNKEYYPLNFGYMERDGKIYYDRAERKKNYIYIALETGARDRRENDDGR